ncbi:MAG: hypothetical protein FJY34_04500 [Betaproteobacteria bacterium]|nr:hypothetical protein [Betaproteobacteria bacterium]
MASQIDLTALLDQTFYGLDTLAMLGDLEDFIEFSESNIGWQKRRELRRAEQECSSVEFEEPGMEAQYRDQVLQGVEYRFEVSLRQRVRYAALVALITTIEWLLLILKKRACFTFPKRPEKVNEAVYTLNIFNDKAILKLDVKIQLLEKLIHVRNCIVHAAGLLQSYQHHEQLRQAVAALQGIQVTNQNFLGDSIEIEAGFLEGVIQDARIWLPHVEKVVTELGLIR